MKRFYTKTRMFAVLLSFLAFGVAAQPLSGVVTVDNNAGPSPTNFVSFTALAAALNANGISGPLTVNVDPASGPYNEQVIFNDIVGCSGTQTITINGNGRTVTFNSTSTTARHTIMFNGTDNVHINNLIVEGTNITNAFALRLYNTADSNSVRSCTFIAQANTTNVGSALVSIGGSAATWNTAGASGSYNEFVDCTMSGGYVGVSMTGPASAPFMQHNKVINCRILDSYLYGVFTTNAKDHIIRNNIFDRPTRSVYTTYNGIYMNTGSERTLVEKNIIRNSFAMAHTNTSAFYGIYLTGTSNSSNPTLVKNNLIENIASAGAAYGIYVLGSMGNTLIYHNTISFDHLASTATGVTRGIWVTTAGTEVRNNIITIGRGGNGVKNCLYYTGANIVSDNNVLFINALAGSNNIGYWNANIGSLAQWQGANGGIYDAFSVDSDPMYTVPGTDYTPTSLIANNLGVPVGVTDDLIGASRSAVTPDPGAYEFYNTPCFGIPSQVAVTGPTVTFCQKTSTMISIAAGSYTNSGYTFQWGSATNVFGPYTAISGETVTAIRTPETATVTTYYSATVTCAGGGSAQITPFAINMAPITTTTVPFFESFEDLNDRNGLPNCSWLVSNTVTAVTQTSANTGGRIPSHGTNFAMFENTPPGVNYLYTEGIQLTAGITYSASLKWLTESVGYNNWTDLSIMIGQNQSPAGQVQIATTGGPAISPIHKILGNTFTVPATGIYYVAVRATAVAGDAKYLSWDELRIDMPCDLNGPTVSFQVLSETVCSDKPMSISASGADTYLWSHSGETTSAISVTPNISTTYTVMATKLLSGCATPFYKHINVIPSPQISASANLYTVCAGSPVVLSALAGAEVVAYSWNHGVNAAAAVGYPTAPATVYTVVGVSANGCDSRATVTIAVNAQPAVGIVSSSTIICSGDDVTLNGTGASAYNWISNTGINYSGNPLTLNPLVSTIFTVTGTDANTCSNKAFLTLLVEACTGLSENTKSIGGLKLYPNPNNGIFTLEANTNAEKQIELADVTGRIILTEVSTDTQVQININAFADGIYYLKVKSDSATEVIKVVKSN